MSDTTGPMVGRSQELGRLGSLLDDACAGNGRFGICTEVHGFPRGGWAPQTSSATWVCHVTHRPSTGRSLDNVRGVEEKVGSREEVDGLLVERFGQDGDYIRHLTIRESRAHKDRHESERPIPVFRSLGMAAEVMATTEFATCEADPLYLR